MKKLLLLPFIAFLALFLVTACDDDDDNPLSSNVTDVKVYTASNANETVEIGIGEKNGELWVSSYTLTVVTSGGTYTSSHQLSEGLVMLAGNGFVIDLSEEDNVQQLTGVYSPTDDKVDGAYLVKVETAGGETLTVDGQYTATR